jgi:hypothetical protein
MVLGRTELRSIDILGENYSSNREIEERSFQDLPGEHTHTHTHTHVRSSGKCGSHTFGHRVLGKN